MIRLLLDTNVLVAAAYNWLWNAFGVPGVIATLPQGAPRTPAAPSPASTLGFGIKPLRGRKTTTHGIAHDVYAAAWHREGA